ncbi:MAG: hypothetical protein DWP98_12390 [Bacteroidetes bacterium]|nr:MAG: hypothetical protein DWP98_12390 [Bacteroidota bacterium]MBL1145504.1 hypothetical protein [Bacteroidota bacterium]NOG58302.1 hypothetical protein [Bacteroidota bacterium]
MSKLDQTEYYKALSSIAAVVDWNIINGNEEETSSFLLELTKRLEFQIKTLITDQGKFENLFLKNIELRKGWGSVSIYQASLKRIIETGHILADRNQIAVLLDFSRSLNEMILAVVRQWSQSKREIQPFYKQRAQEFLDITLSLRTKVLTEEKFKNFNYTLVCGWYQRVLFDSNLSLDYSTLKYFNEQLKRVFIRSFEEDYPIQFNSILSSLANGSIGRYSSLYYEWNELLRKITQANKDIQIFDLQFLNLQNKYQNVISFKEKGNAISELRTIILEKKLSIEDETLHQFESSLFKSVAFYEFQKTLIHIAAIALPKKHYHFFNTLMYGTRIETNVSISYGYDIMPVLTNFEFVVTNYYDIRMRDPFDLGMVDKDLFIDMVFVSLTFVRWFYHFHDDGATLFHVNLAKKSFQMKDLSITINVIDRITQILEVDHKILEKRIKHLDDKIWPKKENAKKLIEKLKKEKQSLLESGKIVVKGAPLLKESLVEVKTLLERKFNSRDAEIQLYRDLGILLRKPKRKKNKGDRAIITAETFLDRKVFIEERFSIEQSERNYNIEANLILKNWGLKLEYSWLQRFIYQNQTIVVESNLESVVTKSLFDDCIVIGINYNFYNFEVSYASKSEETTSLIGQLKQNNTNLYYLRLAGRNRYIMVTTKEELGKLYISDTCKIKFEEENRSGFNDQVKVKLSAAAGFEFVKPLKKTRLFELRDR